MTMQKPVFTPTMSFGNIVQTLTLVAAIAGGAAMLRAQSEQNTREIREVRAEVDRALSGNRLELQGVQRQIRELELGKARDDERFTNILQFMSRIDTRLERIEQGGAP